MAQTLVLEAFSDLADGLEVMLEYVINKSIRHKMMYMYKHRHRRRVDRKVRGKAFEVN